MSREKIRIGVVGFGWMGQAHTRSYLRIPTTGSPIKRNMVNATSATSSRTTNACSRRRAMMNNMDAQKKRPRV